MDSFITISACYITYILIGVILAFSIFKKDMDKIKSMQVFFITYSIYSVYIAIIYLGYITRGGWFISPDEHLFYTASEALGNMSNIRSIYETCFVQRVHIENEGAYFTRGVVAYVANNYLYGNSPLIQYLNSAFIGSLCSVFMYKILLQFIDAKKSFKYTLIYVAFSYLMLSAGKLTRDVYINFFYIWALSILFSDFSVRKLILLFVLVLVTMQFRLEHGLFMAFIPMLFIYEKAKERANFKLIRKLLIVVMIIIAIAIAGVVLVYLKNIMSTMEGYVEFTSKNSEQGGLGKYILRLPAGIKQIAIIIHSQMEPFPSWKQLLESNNIFEMIGGGVVMVSPFFWFVVCFCTLRYSMIKGFYKDFPIILRYSGLVLILFLLVNTSNMNPRRLVCMYPILFTVYSIGSTKYPTLFRNNMIRAVFIYLCLCGVYLLIKY